MQASEEWDAYAEELTSAWLLDPWTPIEDVRTWMRGQTERMNTALQEGSDEKAA